MATLTANMDATTNQLSADVEPGFYLVDSERMRVRPERWAVPGPPRVAVTTGRFVQRGIAGTTAAAHASGATLTRYYPDAEAGGEGTPLPYMDPTTSTPEAIVDAMIAGGKMDGPP